MKFDIIVIGAGSGGLNIAAFMNKVGFKVLLIDKTDHNIGGDCLNYGCVPSKALIHVAREVYHANNAKKFGLKTSGKVDMKKVEKYIKSKQNVIRTHENAKYFRKIGMTVELGKAKFVSKNSISINGKTYSAKRIILATGSRPKKLEVKGAERVKYITNEQVFDTKKLPKHLVIIGGGPIGIELAQAFRRLGSKVSVIERQPTFLPKEMPGIADILLHQLQNEGVEFHFNCTPINFPNANTVIVKNARGTRKTLKFDKLLVSAGRQLNIEGLDLEKAGIEVEGMKLKIDEYLRTTNKNVFVCGDIAGGYQFTHAAELHAAVLIHNFFSPFKKKLSYDNLSWVTYTSPEIATFGLGEKELDRRGINYQKLTHDFEHDDRAIVDETTNGKLIIYIADNKILGGTMVGANAGEIFQELVLANSAGIKIQEIFKKIYPYPTASRVNKRIIQLHFGKRLTKFSKKLLQTLY